MATQPKHILIIQGHPDPQGHHFGHTLAEAYAKGAVEAGHQVDLITVATLDFPLLRSSAAMTFSSVSVIANALRLRRSAL